MIKADQSAGRIFDDAKVVVKMALETADPTAPWFDEGLMLMRKKARIARGYDMERDIKSSLSPICCRRLARFMPMPVR